MSLVGIGMGVASALLPFTATSAEPFEYQADDRLNNSYAYSFISSPDFLNTDVGDVSTSPYYRAGMPNSINESYARSLNTVLNTFQAEHVKDLLVAGDLVEGHWWVDTAKTGTFGPLDSFAGRKRAVRLAGNLYYEAWERMVRGHGLRPFPALGDHDIGDNPWHDRNRRTQRKRALVATYKSVFGDNFLKTSSGVRVFKNRPKGPAKNTAYAYRLHPEVQLVSIDVFQKTQRDVIASVDNKQLEWLDQVLSEARSDGVDWIIVQGHTPVLGPLRSFGSSRLMYRGGKASKLWKLFRKYDVNAYFAGEVHAVTAAISGGVAQVAHGGLFTSGRTNYIRVDVTRSQMRITSSQFTADFDKSEKLWGMDETKGGPAVMNYYPHPHKAGSMIITRDHELVDRTGNLAAYHP